MTFIFRRKNGKILVKSKFQNPTMTEAILFLSEYKDQKELIKKIEDRKVEVFAMIRDKTWQPMGVINKDLFYSTLKSHGKL